MIRLSSRLRTRLASHTHRFLSSTVNSQDSQQTQSTPQAFKAEPLRFYGNTELKGSAEERMKPVFGGRLEGGARQASSRRDAGEPRMIAGVLVPDRPREPDNCCMSGCVNCVWEQYNDDIRDWRQKRNDAAMALKETEEQWPADFHPPLKVLEFKNVPRELRATKRKMSKGTKKLSSAAYFPTNGKPGAQNLKKEEEQAMDASAIEDDEWANVPIQFRAFAEHEKMLKEKKEKKEKKKKRELEAKKAQEARVI